MSETIIIAESAANAALDSFTITTASLHSDNPGLTGANEVTGGSYARQSFTFSAASAGARVGNATSVFDVINGTTINWVAYWNGPTFVVARKTAAPLVFSQDGKVNLDSATKLEL